MTYIIAEIGINHDGKLDKAIEMVEAVAKTGADCAKFQMYRTETLVSQKYQPELFKKLKDCELEWRDYAILRAQCHKNFIEFMCTPDCIGSAVFLNRLQKEFKISSIGACNLHLVRLVATFGKPVYISKGLINPYGVEMVERILQDVPFTWMFCVPSYPADPIEYSTAYMCPGISDHTTLTKLPIEGTFEVVEKHFTLNKNDEGMDHHMSLEPEEFKNYVRSIR